MKKPYVICHMMCSLDGRIILENWGKDAGKFAGVYEKCHDSFESQAWMVGRVTLEKDFTSPKPKLSKPQKRIEKVPFIGNKNASSFAVALDPKGRLGWKKNEIDGDHIIAILLESVSNNYLNYLQQKQISYIFAGKDEVSFRSALNQLVKLFPIRTLMLEGGGHINGSVLNEGLIDEISLLIVPVADGSPDAATTFEISGYLKKRPATSWRLQKMEKLKNDVIWLRYKTKNKI